MKKITLSILSALILSVIIRGAVGAYEVESATDKLIRLHVVANSNSSEDQALKLLVRDRILEFVSEITECAESKEEAEEIIRCETDEITAVAQEALSGSGYSAEVFYEKVLVDKREYDGFTLPEGYYDALCVVIGEGEGKNWWCVLYPSLCVSGAISLDDCEEFDDSELIIIKEPEKVRYKLFCYELWQKLKKTFSGGKSLVGT